MWVQIDSAVAEEEAQRQHLSCWHRLSTEEGHKDQLVAKRTRLSCEKNVTPNVLLVSMLLHQLSETNGMMSKVTSSAINGWKTWPRQTRWVVHEERQSRRGHRHKGLFPTGHVQHPSQIRDIFTFGVTVRLHFLQALLERRTWRDQQIAPARLASLPEEHCQVSHHACISIPAVARRINLLSLRGDVVTSHLPKEGPAQEESEGRSTT